MINSQSVRVTGMGGHQSAAMLKDEWLTPPEILRALGSFDLDPCSPINRPWPTARVHYTITDDGLSRPWMGRVWFNPPYGGPKIIGPWMRRWQTTGMEPRLRLPALKLTYFSKQCGNAQLLFCFYVAVFISIMSMAKEQTQTQALRQS